ncbi:hypothetical protein L7F22_044288 [Adiantum nelumboides]|nr:hypothetical protein [Adiantum nelumboides]
MDRYFVKIEKYPSDFTNLVPVNYNGSCYFDDEGIMCLVVQNAYVVDEWGMTGTKEKVDTKPEEAPPLLNKENVKLRRINDTTRVNTNNTYIGLYKCESDDRTFYYRHD